MRRGSATACSFEDLSFSLPPAGIVGVIGPNGAGKTTLFRMIAGEEQPDAGELRIGDTVELAYVDQSRGDLDPKNTVWKEISGGQDMVLLGKKEINSRQYTSWFNFRGGDQQKPVSQLSGGERNRVHLAKLLKSGGNVLLLDEPTNDLDVDTLRALEEALLDFAGCAVVITHDRWFLDRVATHILAFEGDSQVDLVRGLVGRVRGLGARDPRARGARAPPHQVQAADPGVSRYDLDAAQLRVLGALIEKQRTTPDQYPLSLNALRLACNQTTSREPVMDLDENEVRAAVQRLGQLGFARLASGPGSRAAKYRQLFDEALSLDPSETAVLAVLMLRGAQTAAELKTRTERLGDVGDAHAVLVRLDERELVSLLPRQPGQREERWTHLLGGGDVAARPDSPEPAGLEERLAAIEERLAELERRLLS